MNTLALDGKTVAISGASGALGVAIVERLTNLGASVAALDISSSAEISALSASAGERLKYYECDISDNDAVAETLIQVTRDISLPDIVCCHAGIVGLSPIEQYSIEDFDALMKVNVRGSFILARAASRLWIEQKAPGHLIFTSSWVQDVPWPGITPYAASKSAMRSMARGFARELARKKIRANVVAPGIVAAGMALKSWNEDPEYRERAQRSVPLGYLQPLDSVADAFAFLCSDLASYMTGSVLLVDGGCSLFPD